MVHLLLIIIYISFVSLGLPDALLGAAWPTMCLEFSVPVSYAGAISMIIAAGTIVSSLLSDRMTRWLGPGKVTAISVAMTALAIFGFSVSNAYWMLILWAIPYGLGAGSVDASLNNYVALHYASRHMSWLHCMWGLGASIGPYILGYALSMNSLLQYNTKPHTAGRILCPVHGTAMAYGLSLYCNSSDRSDGGAAVQRPVVEEQEQRYPRRKSGL